MYSAAGRRLLPAMQLGAPPAFLAAAGWQLLAAAADGGLWVWDLRAPAVRLRASAAPLLALAPSRGSPLPPFSARSGLPWRESALVTHRKKTKA